MYTTVQIKWLFPQVVDMVSIVKNHPSMDVATTWHMRALLTLTMAIYQPATATPRM